MKERLDVLLVNRGLAPSRRAKTMIMEGNVFVENQREDKAGGYILTRVRDHRKGNTLKYVVPSGVARKSHDAFRNHAGRVRSAWISGNPPVDYRLHVQNGAVKVYSVDVGYGQFAWRLRQDRA